MKGCLIALLSIMLLSATAFGQTTASLSGTVMDTSRAVLPGTSILAVNEDTGVETRTTSNNAGVYNFPSLQPGTYRVTAEASGFQRAVTTDVRLGAGVQGRLNFDLAVAGTTTEVEVTASAESMVLEAGSSTGTVLQENAVIELPLVSNDAIELVNIMGGVVKSDSPFFNNSEQTFAGVSGNNINMTRDGIPVNELRYNSGLSSPSRLNPELVGEFKMILSPVDAELGRGAGQVQMTTRSGTNAFRGSGVWNIQNTALDSYTFDAKRRDPSLIVPRAWRNLNSYTLTASGPIIPSRTFFFVSWDQQIARMRNSITPRVLTPCAYKGIYRYLDGVRSANSAADPAMYTGRNGQRSPSRPSVDVNGNPLLAYTYPNESRFYDLAGQTVTSDLKFESVLGVLDPGVRAKLADPNNPHGAYGDCGDYDFLNMPNNGIVANSAWDNYRNQYDQSGFVSRFNALMLPANDYQTGDGLNVAGYRWTRTLKGEASVYGGSIQDDNRKAITFKIDHNINSAHRASGTFSYETNAGPSEEGAGPDTYSGLVSRKPKTFTLALVSTLSPTLLNELRFGASLGWVKAYNPIDNPENDGKLAKVLMDLLPTTPDKFPYYSGLLLVAGPGDFAGTAAASTFFHPSGGGTNLHPHGNRGNLASTWGGEDTRWTLNDSITWMRGVHSFKAGFEHRRNRSYQISNGASLLTNSLNTLATVNGGILSDYSGLRENALSSWAGMPAADYDYTTGGNTRSGNYATAYNLMTYMTGSIGQLGQYFYVTDAKNPRWNNVAAGEVQRQANLRSRDWSLFFKDDWKITNDLTLNLGARWEYYGPAWEDTGLGAGVKDNIKGMLGASGLNDITEWMPKNPADTTYRTQQLFIGPGSLNPDLMIFNRDLNNWAPHIGFAWQLPWFGRGLTTLRGGYSISYTQVATFDHDRGFGYVLSANVPGTSYPYYYQGSADCLGAGQGCYLNYSNFGSLLPLFNEDRGWVGLPADQQPTIMGIRSVESREQILRIFDPNVRSPYIQNLTLSLTRSLGTHFTADVRYIGTLSRKMMSNLDLNNVNFINNGMMDELITVRAGGESDVLNGYIQPGALYNVGGAGMSMSGSEQIRRAYASALATGNLASVARSLANANGDQYSSLGPAPSGVNGRVLRAGGAPETLFFANPQYAQALVMRNQNTSNYHSMQAQLTMRPKWGLNFQATYTWSRNLGRQAISDYRNWNNDYWLNGSHRSHTFTSNGNYTLPFGTNGFLLRNSPSAIKKTVEGWNLGWILSLSSGAPLTVDGITTLWANGSMDKVGPFDTKSGKAEWDWEIYRGQYLGGKYMRVDDPQCDGSLVAASLKASCRQNMKAIALIDSYTTNAQGQQVPVPGQIIFQNSEPGRHGNFRGNQLTGIGRFSLDANLSKSIEFMEGKRLEIRIDAMNVLNHATMSNAGGGTGARGTSITTPIPVNNTSTDPWGFINTKNGRRVFQGRLRLSF